MEKQLWDFLELVQKMRKKQKDFFKTRDANVLNESIALEKQVDSRIESLQEERLGGSLFEN